MDYVSFPGGTPVNDRRWGAAAGFESAINTLRQQEAQQYALQEMMLQNQKRGMENTRYAAENPSKFAEFDLNEMLSRAKQNTPGFGQQMAMGEMGNAQQQQARGRLAMGTVESEIPATNASNQFKQAKDVLSRIEMLTPMIRQGGMQGNMVYQQLRHSLPPELQGGLPPMAGPEADQALSRIRQHLVQSVPHAQSMEEIDRKGEWELWKQGLANEGHVDAARTRAGAKVRSLIEDFNRAKNAEKLALGAQLLADPDVDDRTRAQVKAAMEMARKAEAERLGRGQVDINNLRDAGAIQGQINQRLGGGEQQPQQQQFQRGQVYRGRTGAYQFLGGPNDDVKNPKFWKKVQ
jgi:hypothetical protein